LHLKGVNINKYTPEQNKIIEIIQQDFSQQTMLYKISAIAGAGKTHTLIGIANKFPKEKLLYIAFNKSVADEASLKFPRNVSCKTIHALAYQYVIKGTGQTIEELSIDSITTKHSPATKRSIIYAINQFFNSSSLSLSFIDTLIKKEHAEVAKGLITKMVDRKMPATFGFMIKYFYLQLQAGNIEVNFDLVMLDEAGDLSEVTLEIFKLLNAKRKVMVGDQYQNIYAFMNTVNGFEILKDEGISLTLSQSFRVRTEIAKDIEKFCRKFMDKDMNFKGIELSDDEPITTKAFLSRTNSGLISRMMDLHTHKISYTTLRHPAEIFALPLALISVSNGKPVYKAEFKYLEKDYRKFHSDADLKSRFNQRFHAYLREIHGDDPSIVTALRLLETHSYKAIFETYSLAKSQPKKQQAITLATAHTSKGSTYDSVQLENDLNNTIQKIKDQGGPQTDNDLTELNLYYVACSRCRLELSNATHL
jgi:superfamily I DNA/RNA helicase